MKIITWTKDQAKKELKERLSSAVEARREREAEWQAVEEAVFRVSGINNIGAVRVATPDHLLDGVLSDVEKSAIQVNKIFKNYRFLHSQLSANPPSVVARPASGDQDDRRRADAADRLVRHAIRKYRMQEYHDLCTAQTLLYGTGFQKVFWDPDAGDLIDFDRETGEVTLEGDISVTVPLTWNIYIDPDADVWDDVRFVFECLFIPYEKALSRWPEHADTFKRLRKKETGRSEGSASSYLNAQKYDVIKLFEYWEKGLPSNGMQGRFAYCLEDGTIIGELEENPHRFSVEKDEKGHYVIDSDLKQAYLPYHILTDVDIVGSVWGKSTLVYQIPLQDVHNKIINATIDSVRAHGVARLILDEKVDIAEDSFTNSPVDIIRKSGTGELKFIEPMQLPAAMSELLALTGQGVDDMAGVNESMFGQQSREQSGFSMQYATNQGNMIRRRLFNKYVLLTEGSFKTFLSLVRDHWDIARDIRVLGKEKAFEALDIAGADITGGYDLVVEYGASLSLDPVARRQEIMTLMPVFQQEGVPTGTILSMLKLNELENIYDAAVSARERQSEYFTAMNQTGRYIPPRKMQNHAKMLEYAYEYIMSAEFRDLEEYKKKNIEKHIEEREQLAAQGPAPAGGDVGMAGQSAAPAGETLPGGAGMEGQQAQVTTMPPMMNT